MNSYDCMLHHTMPRSGMIWCDLTLRSKPRFLSGLLPFERPEPQISQMVLKGLDQREKEVNGPVGFLFWWGAASQAIVKPWFQNGSLLISLHIRIFLDGCKRLWHITMACRSILGCLTARESPTLATYSQLSPCSQPQTLTPVEQSKVQPKCVQMLPAILGLPLRQGNEEPRLSRFLSFSHTAGVRKWCILDDTCGLLRGTHSWQIYWVFVRSMCEVYITMSPRDTHGHSFPSWQKCVGLWHAHHTNHRSQPDSQAALQDSWGARGWIMLEHVGTYRNHRTMSSYVLVFHEN